MKKMSGMTSMAAIHLVMGMESKQKKTKILVVSIVVGVVSLIFAGLFLARFASTQSLQSAAQDLKDAFGSSAGGLDDLDLEGLEDAGEALGGALGGVLGGAISNALGGAWVPMTFVAPCDPDLATCYDVGCNPLGAADFEDFTTASEYALDYALTCLGDIDCGMAGSRWSHIFLMQGLLFLFIMLNFGCIAVGAYKPVFRLIGAWCASCLCCAHFGIIIATAVYRFRAVGKMCALSEQWTNFSSDIEDTDDTWTYKSDGALILAIWIIQLLTFCCCCCAGSMPLRPSVKN
jgi:hypothetical protein